MTLLRNLYGAPFLKPDVHILAIASTASGTPRAPGGPSVRTTQVLGRCHGPPSRLRPIHMGICDYVLWWYRQRTGLPA